MTGWWTRQRQSVGCVRHCSVRHLAGARRSRSGAALRRAWRAQRPRGAPPAAGIRRRHAWYAWKRHSGVAGIVQAWGAGNLPLVAVASATGARGVVLHDRLRLTDGLGREGSNLRMGESKSGRFPNSHNGFSAIRGGLSSLKSLDKNGVLGTIWATQRSSLGGIVA